MRSRIATGATIVLLLAGTGGAIAIGEGGSAGAGQGGAATAQYKPGKGCGKGHAPRHKKCPKPKSHKPHKKAKKPKRAHRPAKKRPPRSVPCQFRTVGQTLVAYCPKS
jgi:hypothetical protein